MPTLFAAHRLSRNTLILLTNNAATAVLAFALTIVIARGLGDAALGRYAAVMAWVLPLSLLTEFGVGTLITRNVAQNHAAAAYYLKATYPLRWGLGGGIILLVWATAPWLSNDPQIIAGLRVGVALALIDALFAGYTAVFRAWEVMWPILALNTGYLALQVAGALVVAARDGSVVDLVAVVVIADAVQLAATWGIWRRLKNKRHPQPLPMHGEGSTERFIYQGKGHLPLRQLLQQAWPFATAGVLATLHIRLIVLILQANASAEVVGWYAAASRTVEAARMLPQALFGALFPALAALAIDPPRMQRTLRQAALILTGYGLLIGLLSLASAKPLIRLLFGSGFDEAAGALIILAWALLPGTLRGLLTLWFYAHHREWTANRLTGFALVLQIGLGLALVERYGLAGAAWTVVIAETFLAGLLFGAACWGGAKISFRRRKPG